jgi:hypothetical protein
MASSRAVSVLPGPMSKREAVVEDSGGGAGEVARVGDRRPVLAVSNSMMPSRCSTT